MPANQGTIEVQLNVPTYAKELMINKVVNGEKVSQKADIAAQSIVTFTANQRILACETKIYGVTYNHGGGQMFDIDPTDGGDYTRTVIQNPMPDGGSMACAVDKYNKRVYVGFRNQHLRYYSIDDGTWTTVSTSSPFGRDYPRMEYHHGRNELWVAHDKIMHILDANTGQSKKSYVFDGFGDFSPGGGDIAIALDGTTYMCTHAGLYKFVDFDPNVTTDTIKIERISAESLDYRTTSLAIDQDQRIYLGTVNGSLLELDPSDGSYILRKKYDAEISDLSAFPCTVDECPQVDTDNDGCIDCVDEFPEDPSLCGTFESPSKFGWGSIAFEDLWPSKGNYDFNDLVVNFRFKLFMNGNNKATKMEVTVLQKARVASFDNGFGVMLPAAVTDDKIASVSGYSLTSGNINLNGKGIEVGHNGRVVLIPYDQSSKAGSYGSCLPKNEGNAIKLLVTFTEPLDVDDFDLVDFPYNPFIFQNGVRSHEIHLFNHEPTALHDGNIFNTVDDDSNPLNDKFYQNSRKHPWALNIIHDYRVVNEGIDITNAYNNFKAWAESGGTTNQDWYKDNPGNRNTEHICTEN